VKIIASDYDGTLRHGHGISEADRNAVKTWREAGNLFGIVTGRSRDMLKTVEDDKLDIDFVIIYNGVEIYDIQGNLKKRFTGQSDRFYELLPFILRKKGDWAEFITNEQIYYLTYGDEPDTSRNNWYKGEIVKDLREFMQIYSLYDTEAEALEVSVNLNECFSDIVSPLVNGRWLNATPSGINKASGVAEYAKIMGVPKENIYTIGDSYNDLDMIKAFNGYTLENGADDVKKEALAVYKGVWELIACSM
jgi:HAD-superfamily hydrolase, subfamily IIB